MKAPKNIDIKSFSPHLFWDVDVNNIDIRKNPNWFIERVLEYGLINDWKLLKKTFGLNEISFIATTLRDLSPKTISFIALLAGIPKENFKCYNTQQSQTSFWNS